MTIKTADEMMASVDATLSDWRSAFENNDPPSLPPAGGKRGGEEGGVVVGSVHDDDDADVHPSRHPSSSSSSSWGIDGYRRRLGTFGPSSYFAKPLALSPLVCAAFGWENTGKDILRCAHCDSAICVTFHPSLDEESRGGLCRKYLDMLVSSHASTCTFRSHASRWSRVMGKCNNPGGGDGVAEREGSKNRSAEMIVAAEEGYPELLAREVGDALGGCSNDANFYVPPYFLAISDEFLRFEDRTADGSITRDLVGEGAARIRDELQSMDIGDSQVVDVTVPDAVKDYCDILQPGVDLDCFFYEVGGGGMRTSHLLSAFGWSVCEESVAGGTGVVLKCTMCQARSWLQLSRSITGEKTPVKKKRRMDASIMLVDSHRVYCPYVSGFSFQPGRQSNLPGWKVVVSNLLKKVTPISDTL